MSPQLEVALSDHPDGVVVRCWVVPGASRSELKGLHGDSLKIRVAAPPQAGRANAEVCRLLEALTGCPADLLGGAGSRSKTVLLAGASRPEVLAALAR